MNFVMLDSSFNLELYFLGYGVFRGTIIPRVAPLCRTLPNDGGALPAEMSDAAISLKLMFGNNDSIMSRLFMAFPI
jgi:hypothetical protein